MRITRFTSFRVRVQKAIQLVVIVSQLDENVF